MKRLVLTIIVGFMAVNAFAADNPALQQALTQVEQSVITTGKHTVLSAEQNIRDQAIQRAAIVYGAQSGRYYRWKQITSLLYKRGDLLSRVFNFGSMYLDNSLVQPPVLDMSSNVTDISNSGQMRELINNVYRVLIPASFKPRPLTWQAFLIPDSLQKPAYPRSALLSCNEYEQGLWKFYIRKGWQQGIEEASNEFSTRVETLENAYQGMVLYTMLAMRGMVAPPQVVKTTKTVESAADGQKMAVGIHEQVISKNSYFVTEPNHWKPVFYGHSFRLHSGYWK